MSDLDTMSDTESFDEPFDEPGGESSEPKDVSEFRADRETPVQLLFRNKLYFVYYIICETHNFITFRLTLDLTATRRGPCYVFHSLDGSTVCQMRIGSSKRDQPCLVGSCRRVTKHMFWERLIMRDMRADGYTPNMRLYIGIVGESTAEPLKKTEGHYILQMLGLRVVRR